MEQCGRSRARFVSLRAFLDFTRGRSVVRWSDRHFNDRVSPAPPEDPPSGGMTLNSTTELKQVVDALIDRLEDEA